MTEEKKIGTLIGGLKADELFTFAASAAIPLLFMMYGSNKQNPYQRVPYTDAPYHWTQAYKIQPQESFLSSLLNAFLFPGTRRYAPPIFLQYDWEQSILQNNLRDMVIESEALKRTAGLHPLGFQTLAHIIRLITGKSLTEAKSTIYSLSSFSPLLWGMLVRPAVNSIFGQPPILQDRETWEILSRYFSGISYSPYTERIITGVPFKLTTELTKRLHGLAYRDKYGTNLLRRFPYFGVADLGDILRMSLDYGMKLPYTTGNEINVDRLVEKTRSMAKVIEAGMAIYHTMDKEKVLQNILELGRTSVSIENIPVLEQLLYRLNTIAKMTNISVDMVQKLSSIMSQVYEHIGIPAQYGAKITMGGILFTKYLTQGIPGLYKPQFTSEELQKSGGARQIRINLEQIGTSVLASSASKEMGLWIQSQIKKGVPQEEAIRRALVKMSRGERLEASTTARLEEEIRNEAIKKGFKPGTIAFNEYVEETKEKQMAEGVELTAKYISQHPMETRPYISRAFLLSIIKKDLGMDLKQFQHLSYEDQKKMVSGAITNYHPNIASNKTDADSIAATLIKSANFPTELGRKIDVQIMLEEEQQRLTQYTRQADNYKLRMDKIFSRLNLNKSIPEIIKELIKQGSTIFGQQYNIMGENIKAMSDKEIEDFFVGILRPYPGETLKEKLEAFKKYYEKTFSAKVPGGEYRRKVYQLFAGGESFIGYEKIIDKIIENILADKTPKLSEEEQRILKSLDLKKLRKKVAIEGLTLKTIISEMQNQDIFSHDPIKARDQALQYINLINFIIRLFKESKDYKVMNETAKRYQEINKYLNKMSPIEVLKQRLYGVETPKEETSEEEKDYFKEALLFYAKHPEKIFEKRKLDIGDIRYRKYPIIETYANALFMSGQIQSIWDHPKQLKTYEKIRKKIKAGKINLEDIQDWSDILELLIEEGDVDTKRLKTDVKYKKYIAQKIVNIGNQLIKEFGTTKKIPTEKIQKIIQHPYKFTDEALEKLYLDFISTSTPRIRFRDVFEQIAPELKKGKITEKGLDRIRYFLDYLKNKDFKAYTEAIHLLSQDKRITEAATVKIEELSNKEFYKYIPALFYFKGAPQEFKLDKYPASLVKYSAKLLSGLKKGEDWKSLLQQLPYKSKEEINKYTAGKSIQEITQELNNIREEIQKQVDYIFNKLLSSVKKGEIKEHYKKYSDNLKKVIEVIISNNETLQKIFKQESISIESLLEAIGVNKHYIDTLIKLQQKKPEALTTEQKQLLDKVKAILNITRYSGTKVTFKDIQDRTAYSRFIEPIKKEAYSGLKGLIPTLRSTVQKQKIPFTAAQEILQKFSPTDIETMLKSKNIEELINYASQKKYISKQKLLQGDTEEITKMARLIKALQTFTTQEYNPWGQKFVVRTALSQKKQSEKNIKPLYEYMQKQGLTAIEQLEKSQAEPKGLVLQILNSEEFQKLARNRTATMKDLINLLHEKTYISKRLYYQNEPHTVGKVLYFLRMLNTIPAHRRPTFVSNIQYQLEQYRETFQKREQQEQQLKEAYQSYAKAPIISYIDIPTLKKEERKITSLPQEETEKYKKGLLSYSKGYIEAINKRIFLEYYPDKDKATILQQFISKAQNLHEIYKEAQKLGLINLAKLKTGDSQEYLKLGALHGLIQIKAPEKIKKELQEQDQAGIFFIPSASEEELPFIFSPYRPSVMLNAIIGEREWIAKTTLKQTKNITPEARQELQFQVDFFKALQEGKLNKALTQKDIDLSGLIKELRNAKLINPNLLFKSPRERRKLSFAIGFLRKYGLLSQNLEDQLFELETLYNTDLFTRKISEEQYRKIEEGLLRKPPQSIEDVKERIQKIVPELSEEELNQATKFFYVSSLPPRQLKTVAGAYSVNKKTVETYTKILKYLYSKPKTRDLLRKYSILEKYQTTSGKKYITIRELADLYGKSPQYILGIIPQTAIKKVPTQNLILYYTTLKNRLAQLKEQQTKINIETLSKKIRTKPEILRKTLKTEEISPEEAIKKIQHTINLLSHLPQTTPISSLKKIIDLPEQFFRKIATITPIESIELEDVKNLFEAIKEGVRKQYEEGSNILDIEKLSEETGITSKILLRIFGRKSQKTDKAYYLIRRALEQLDKYSKEGKIKELRGEDLIGEISKEIKIPSKILKQAVLKQKSEKIKGEQEVQINTILKNLESTIKKILPTQAQLEKYQLFTHIRTLANEPQAQPSQLKTVVPKAVQTLDLAERKIFDYARKTPNEIIAPEYLQVPLQDIVLRKILTKKEQKFYKENIKRHAESYAELLENLNKKIKEKYLDAKSQAFSVLNFYHIPHEKITEEDLETGKYPKKLEKGVELLRDMIKKIKKEKPKLKITTETLKRALYEEEYLPEDIKQLREIRDKIQKYIRQKRIIKTTKFYEEVIQQIPKLTPDAKRSIVDILKKQIKEKAGDITLEDIGAELEKAKDKIKKLTAGEIPTIETIKGKIKHPAQMITSWEMIETIAEKEQIPLPKNPMEKAKLLVAIMRKLATDSTVPQPIRKEYQNILQKLQKQAERMEEGLTTESSSAKEKYIKIGEIEKLKYEDIYRIQQTEAMRQKYKLPSDFRKVMEEMKIEDLEAQQKAKKETLHTIALTMETPLIQLLSPRNKTWWNKILFAKKSTKQLTKEELDLAEMLTKYLENRKQYYLIKGDLRLTPEEKKEKLKKIQQQAEEMIQQFSEKYHIPLTSPENFLAYTIEKVKKIAHKYGTERLLYGGLRGRVQELERVEALGQTSTAIGTLSEINIGEKTFKKINETLKGVVDRFYKSVSEKLDIKNDVKDMNQNVKSILESIKDYIDNAQNNNELKFIKKLLESLNNTLDRLNKSLDILDTKIQVK